MQLFELDDEMRTLISDWNNAHAEKSKHTFLLAMVDILGDTKLSNIIWNRINRKTKEIEKAMHEHCRQRR